MRQVIELDAQPAPARPGVPARRPSRRPPPHATITRDVHCAACWYNLRGLSFQGRCPECGTRYDAWRNIQHDDAKTKGSTRRKRYLRTITHEPIVGPVEAFRAVGFILMTLTLTGALILVLTMR